MPHPPLYVQLFACSRLTKATPTFTILMLRLHLTTVHVVAMAIDDDAGLLGAGEVLATLHNRVLQEHREELQPGCAIILRQVKSTLYYYAHVHL